ncbi:MAG: beta-lactamase family protein [Gammaproteobacteria bacterium]|nr:beta-lactamase family protein [Gammaproteobacteria bacterium]
MTRLLKIVILFFIFQYSSVHAADHDKLKVTADRILASNSFNGIVQISQNGELISSKTKGFSNFEKKLAVRPDTQFVFGSTSKQITAILVLTQVEKGNLRLKDV